MLHSGDSFFVSSQVGVVLVSITRRVGSLA